MIMSKLVFLHNLIVIEDCGLVSHAYGSKMMIKAQHLTTYTTEPMKPCN